MTNATSGAGGEGLNSVIKLVRVGGVIVSYGATAGAPSNLALAPMFLKNVELRGSTMGSPDDFDGLMQVVNQTKLIPSLDSVFGFDKFDAALEVMRRGGQFGKIVLDHTNNNKQQQQYPNAAL
jgi:zinc-binding alcohol dehydrogenase/oxidoreductase